MVIGGAAVGGNIAVFRTSMPLWARVLIAQAVGVAAVLLWFLSALIFALVTR